MLPSMEALITLRKLIKININEQIFYHRGK